MPIPSLVTDLSTTIASNSPSGSDNVFPDLDNYLRALSGFVASIRDNSGNGWVSPYLPTAGGTVTGALAYSNTLTGGTGVVNLGSGQFYKDASGNIGIGTTPSSWVSGVSAVEMRRGSVGSLPGGPVTHAFVAANAYATGSTDPAFATWKYPQTGEAHLLEVGNSVPFSFKVAASGSAGGSISWTTAMFINSLADTIHNVNTSAPSLSANSQMVFSLTSNTNLRISVRGTDGVTRTANITLS